MSSSRPAQVLQISDLRVVRESKVILDGVDWTIHQGEHWVVLGPNGSGKSSLLSVLGGYLAPTAGEFQVLGEHFGQSDWRELRGHLGIVSAALAAMVPEDEPAFCTVLTGRDGGIGLWAEVTHAERDEAISWLAKVEAEALVDRPWRVLSMGERQRVLIARALIRSPRLLILDEPCAGLDPVAREGFLAFVGRLVARRSGPSVVLVTHHVEEIMPGFTHGLFMRRGRVAASGPLNAVMRSKVLESVFDAPVTLRRTRNRYSLDVPAPKRGVL